MTEEQFAVLLRMVAEQTRGAREERGGGWKKASAKTFSRLTKFAKDEENWKDWNFDFVVILGPECPELTRNLEGDRVHVGGYDDAHSW